MRDIILDERSWCENVLMTKSLGDNTGSTLRRLARYYRSQGYGRAETERRLADFMLRCDPDINLEKWYDIIHRIVASVKDPKLIMVSGVSITEAEMDSIKALNGVIRQSFMFTLLCLAKYQNAVRENNSNWVNLERLAIFSAANVVLSTARQSLLINDLCNSGYISLGKRVDNNSIQVRICNDDSPEVVFISDFRNVGNQYRRMLGGKFMECAICGLVIRRNSNAQKFCPKCAVENATGVRVPKIWGDRSA